MAEILESNNSNLVDDREKQLKEKFNQKTASPALDVSALEKALTCDICREIFNEPVTLICNHTFCRYCLRQIKPINQFDKNKKCPSCQLSFWELGSKTVNFTLREAIKILIGEAAYEAKKDERAPSFLRVEIEDRVVDEIKNDLWRSVVDNLKKECGDGFILPPPRKSYGTQQQLPFQQIPLQQPPQVLPYPQIASDKTTLDICRAYNSLRGCQDKFCPQIHEYKFAFMEDELQQLRKEWGYDPAHPICIAYNQLGGCSKGDQCTLAHLPRQDTLWQELLYYREDNQRFFTSLTAYSIGLASFLILMFLALRYFGFLRIL